jgi:diguanylate cyclase (GGDEF)-like protein
MSLIHNTTILRDSPSCFEVTGKIMPTKKNQTIPRGKNLAVPQKKSLPPQITTLNQSLMSLYHASAELQFSKPLPSLLKSILRGLKSGTEISKAAIFISEEFNSSLKGIASVGLNDKKVNDLSIPLMPNEESDLLRLNTVPIADLSTQTARERLTKTFENQLELKSAEILPLEIRDRLVGILVYEKPTHLLHQELLIIFSRQAALTIENAKLFAKVEEMALRDTLTGLYNRRYFQQILEYELNRAKRYHQPLSIIFIDIDHFKEVNDTFGHSMGDQFLKQISLKLLSLFRTTDLIARYAGDEFVAILPTTSHEGAMILANRIQQIVGSYEVMVRGRTLQVSVSIGVDTYEGNDGIGSSTLIDHADKAMYEAKSSGRNCAKSYLEILKTLVH